MRPVDRSTLEPILFLLESPDIEVQRAASAALGNLAVDGTLPYRQHIRALLTEATRPEQDFDRLAGRIVTTNPADEQPQCGSAVQRGRLHNKLGYTRGEQGAYSTVWCSGTSHKAGEEQGYARTAQRYWRSTQYDPFG